jgi:hypothetical protein
MTSRLPDGQANGLERTVAKLCGPKTNYDIRELGHYAMGSIVKSSDFDVKFRPFRYQVSQIIAIMISNK